ncbi:probable protein S-acyltransferase 23 [Lingula anatina]|uniref:Palmitoyltransferase n=1 Tax=Lingula anatina TaxID=7574 RepID=A0A1S3HJR2_LINAN|nr:probable protein S-acyltransferase 23 [Lingula anatina]|eukprot:XP_013386257.1 probable protein S-acyltransferase 23 [Lingula anatina]
MWISLYHANSIDPGFLPRNIPEYDMAIKQVAHFAEWKHGKNPLSRLCHTCRTVKPLRSKHCRICQRCVSEFDHHCPYIYNCVGYNNRVWFTMFVCLVFVNCVITLYFCYWILEANGWDDYITIIGGLEATLFTFLAAVLSSVSLFHATKNITTNERINHKRYDYMKDGKGNFYNPFDRGVWHNIKEFLHLRKPLGEEEVQLLNVV